MVVRCPKCGRRAKRSNEANRRYFALLGKLSTVVYQGKRWSKREWHEMFKDMYIQPDIVTLPDGRRKVCDPHSSEMDTSEFQDYVTKVEVWCGERNVYLDEIA